MRLLDRLLFAAFVRAYLICLISLLSLYVVVDLFTNLDDFTHHGKGFLGAAQHMASYYSVKVTQIFDRPLRGREFFEEIIRDNLDLGRPDRVQLIFDRVVTKKTPGRFRTRVIQDGVHPSLHIQYKNFDLKQYFKEGRGCRTEGTFREPNDFGVNKGLSNLPYLQKIGRQINRRLLEVELVSHNSGMSGDSIDQ